MPCEVSCVRRDLCKANAGDENEDASCFSSGAFLVPLGTPEWDLLQPAGMGRGVEPYSCRGRFLMFFLRIFFAQEHRSTPTMKGRAIVLGTWGTFARIGVPLLTP